jgi:predicted nucleic acid-binding protein
MAFVLDASVAVAWVLSNQSTAYTRSIRVRAKREPYHVPAIFFAEVTNVLVTLQRRALLSEEGAAAASDVLGRLAPVVHPLSLNVGKLRELANRYRLTAYDAWYLALAMELRLPLACGDRPLKEALKSAGVKLA